MQVGSASFKKYYDEYEEETLKYQLEKRGILKKSIGFLEKSKIK